MQRSPATSARSSPIRPMIDDRVVACPRLGRWILIAPCMKTGPTHDRWMLTNSTGYRRVLSLVVQFRCHVDRHLSNVLDRVCSWGCDRTCVLLWCGWSSSPIMLNGSRRMVTKSTTCRRPLLWHPAICPNPCKFYANGVWRWREHVQLLRICVAQEERAMHFDRRNGELRSVGRNQIGGQHSAILLQIRCCCADSFEFGPVGRSGSSEPPAPRLLCDQNFGVVFVGGEVESSRGEHATVVCSTGPWTMLIDRTPVVDQHRAMPVLVVAEQNVAWGQTRSGEQKCGGYVRQRVRLVGRDMNELRGSATCGAGPTGHVRRSFAAQRPLHFGEPGREITCCQLWCTLVVVARSVSHRKLRLRC